MEGRRSNVSRQHMLIVRLFIGAVVFLNLQCALLFLILPGQFAGSFELAGIPGRIAIQGTGLLFVMWNIPYLFALAHPDKNRLSLIEAVLMQTVGLVGESILLAGIPAQDGLLRASIKRFILFDGSGLVVLILALLLVYRGSIRRA